MNRLRDIARRGLPLACAVAAVGIAPTMSGSATAGNGADVICRPANHSGTVPPSVAPNGQPLPFSVAGELCGRPVDLQSGRVIQLLIHGGTYNHTYWNFGTVNGVEYSYARRLAAAGFPAYLIDQIGAGRSSKPSSTALTNDVAAYVTHELVQGLRDGSIAGTPFRRVITVGHSLGNLNALQEAITYQDVDGLILTGAGATHHLGVGDPGEGAQLHPVSADPKYAGAGLDDGYLTTVPGGRAGFYYASNADPDVIAADDNATPYDQQSFDNERGKDVVPINVFVTGLPLLFTTATQAIRVPVLVVLGTRDPVACRPDAQGTPFDCSSGDAIVAQERPYYAPKTLLSACSIQGTGHVIGLERTFRIQETAALAWLRSLGHRRLPKECGFTS